MEEPQNNPYVSRGGLKLAAALEAFGLDVAGFICADLGCNVGGFTDCLLQRGAAKVFAIDTGYGELAWTLRNDERVVVMERTNAMHVDVTEALTQTGLTSTPLPQVEKRLGEGDDSKGAQDGENSPSPQPSPLKGEGVAKPQAVEGIDLAVIDLGWTRQKHAIPAAMHWQPKHIITLIKPHYECEEKLPKGAILDPVQAESIFQRVLQEMAGLYVRVVNTIVSPIRGGKGKGKTGNIEYLAMLMPDGTKGQGN